MEQKVNIVSKQKNKSFCVLPWIHLATHPIGTVTPCCITDMKDGVSTAAHEDNDNLHFFGDRMDKAGNDYPLKKVILDRKQGTCYNVEDYRETWKILKTL